MSTSLIGSIIAVSIMVGLGVYVWYLRNKIKLIELPIDTTEQNNKRIENVETQADQALKETAANDKTHAYDSKPVDLLHELHTTVTGHSST